MNTDNAVLEPAAAPVRATRQPAYRVTESADAYVVRVQVPGVAASGVETILEADTVRITARPAWKAPENWKAVHLESDEADYVLTLKVGARVDRNAVKVELNQGVLTLTLGKAEAVKPRRVEIAG